MADPVLINPFREGLTEGRASEPCAFVIFGATGDLTRRKLIPALFNLYVKGLLPTGCSVIGFARRPWGDEGFRQEMRRGIEEHAPRLLGEIQAWEAFSSRLFYVQSTFDDPAGYRTLQKRLEQPDVAVRARGNRMYYLATPPGEYENIVANLGIARLNRHSGGWTRLIVEKPIGVDLASARELNGKLKSAFSETQIYRIDHFLGKETVQNILVFRFANSILEPIWNHKYIDHIQITIAEPLGLEGRGGYFDKAGLARDLVQNHGLQLLSLFAMEPPVSLEADAIRDEKVKVLKAIPTASASDVASRSVRGQYESGYILGQAVPGYLEEPDIPADSSTETYCAFRFDINNWRWAGVPFYMRAGKRMPKKVTEIALQFKDAPGVLFSGPTGDALQPNLLVIHIQPDEGISLNITSKVPGPAMRLQSVRMDFQYGVSFGTPSPEAYERLLLDAVSGEAALFARDDEVESAWRIIDPFLNGWRQMGRQGLYPYQAGSWGPLEASALMTDAARKWRRL